jgi:hypothetical protein
MTGAEKDQKIKALEKENQALRERIAELERRLGLTQILHLIRQKSKPSPFNQGITVSN